MNDNGDKIIYDFCGGTGAWSEPYRQAGYDVRIITLPMFDVRTFIPAPNAYGALAAPPCTDTSVSGAQYWKQKDIDGRTIESMSVFIGCLRAIAMCGNLAFWSLEQPVGRAIHWLGEPVLRFDPCDYGGYSYYYECKCGCEFEYELGKYGCPNCCGDYIGILKSRDNYTKKTLLWGRFNIPKKNPVEPVRVCSQGSWIQTLGGKSEKTKLLRSITPAGFARAFFLANP